ncbi:MAG: CDP-alcohol phosphatidyltransferase family protein [Candidatus Pacebacteria bacterium]|nr:CDP-alcohol phosphatidyltransferase family protein [Candidatus Paceibacterota bacterium]
MKKDTVKNFQETLDGLLQASLLKLIPRFILPNAFTLLRIFLLPFLLYFFWIEEYGLAVILFAISAFSDLIDGALARTRNQVTEWGTFFDPLADKLLINLTGFFLLFHLGFIFLPMSIIFIDLIISVGAIYKKYTEGISTKAHITGKLKFTLQAFGVGTVMFYVLTEIPIFLTLGLWMLYGAVFFGAISLLVYHSA